MIDEIATGAEDWRSEGAKRQAALRKAAASLFKTWIPDNSEASMERGVCFEHLQKAFAGHPATQITFVSQLSVGIDEIMAHDYLDQPQSMQTLLVEREGTEAFLDAKNALRVVRKKYGMMTLITRLTQTFEQRSIVAITIQAGIPQAELVDFGRLLYRRIEGTSSEEEADLKRQMRRKFPHIDVVYHSELVGRRLPVAWPIKHLYTKVLREPSGRGGDPAAVVRASAPQLNARAIRQVAIHRPALREAMDIDSGYDPAPEILRSVEEQPLLNAARNIYDEFNELRHSIAAGAAMGVEQAADADFSEGLEDDELVALAHALELIREVRGREFFGRISMVSGEISFVASAHDATHGDAIEDRFKAMDPMHALREARSVTEAFYKARALSAVVEPLRAAGHDEAAALAAKDALIAARACKTADVDQAYMAACAALLTAELPLDAAVAVREAVRRAHATRELPLRAASLMRITSTLMQTAGLPSPVRTMLAREILGEDVYFWGKPEVTPALVEVILALLSEDDPDTALFVQKVVAHPNEEVRRSVVRTMPAQDTDLRNVLLSHLRDRDAAVRVEVIHRIGNSGDQTLGLYLVNHIRQGVAETAEEKRAVALDLARLGTERYLPLFNAMLGGMHTPGRGLTDKYKPLKDDADLHMAAIEVLYHLNSREARRLLYKASQLAKRGPIKVLSEQVWAVVKGRPYGDPELPRSPNHPEWTEEDAFDLLAEMDRLAPEPEPEPEPEVDAAEASAPGRPSGRARKGGLFGRLKNRIFKGDEDDDGEYLTLEESLAEDDEDEEGTDDDLLGLNDDPEDQIDAGTPPAALRYEAVLLEGPEVWSGTIPMHFSLYADEGTDDPLWQEKAQEVPVDKGHFNVLLGTRKHLPVPLPSVVWLSVVVDGQALGPRTRLSRARSVIQG